MRRCHALAELRSYASSLAAPSAGFSHAYRGATSSDHIRALVAFSSVSWRLFKLLAESLDGLPNGLVPLAEPVEHEARLGGHFPGQQACLIERGVGSGGQRATGTRQ